MSINSQRLLELLPAIYRIKDAEIAAKSGLEKGPLEDLMSIIAEQMALMEENIQQSYDDLFIETCAEWLTPYIGNLIGYQSLHGSVPDIANPREDVAHTIGNRRRKGTIVVLEQIARDVTQWNATAVEFFKQIGWTQFLNHTRENVYYSPSLRDLDTLSRINSPFNRVQHTVDTRKIESSGGKYNIPNIGIFLWRLDAYAHSNVPAQRLAERRYLIDPLGSSIELFSNPKTSDNGVVTELAKPINVPEPIKRRQLHDHLKDYYGYRATTGAEIDNSEPSIQLYVEGVEIPRDQIVACNLSDDGADWAHQPEAGFYAIDPELGRVALPSDVADPVSVEVSYFHGFSADMGGAEYSRLASFALQESDNLIRVPDQFSDIQSAINALSGAGVVEITDNNYYEEALTIHVAQDSTIELRAADKKNPHIRLTTPMEIIGEESSRFCINGILISGNPIIVPDNGSNQLSLLEINHSTFVPGIELDNSGVAVNPGDISLNLEIMGIAVSINRSIIGAIRSMAEASVELFDSILDANDNENIAFSAQDTNNPGATFSAYASTVIGKIYAREFATVSNSILLAKLKEADSWSAPVRVERKQSGCVRFSFLPYDSIVPRRYRCQPDSIESALNLSPQFTSLKYGDPAYCQLLTTNDHAIWRGADDESEMGVFHHLYGPQRDSNIRIRLQEYLRVGLEAGVFYES
ncbi:hypothetical protein [Aliikangiella sp. IMCC44359]|uniref:hypothetical protein n=1 Tax=Aliikangiella sp. IMCC44359 TaxID=3459125 RepID=UPI00403B103D